LRHFLQRFIWISPQLGHMNLVASPPGGMGLLQLVHVTSINVAALSVMVNVLGDGSVIVTLPYKSFETQFAWKHLHALLLMSWSELLNDAAGFSPYATAKESLFKEPQNPARAANPSVLKHLLHHSPAKSLLFFTCNVRCNVYCYKP
jgi:hypothetical protein